MLFLATAWAANGVVILKPTPGATVSVFPQTDPQRVEWAVYGNNELLNEQLGGLVENVVDTGAQSVGNGTWVVTAWLEEGVTARGNYQWEREYLVLLVELGEPDLLPVQDAPSVEELLAGEVEQPTVPSVAALHPLQGLASTANIDPTKWTFASTPWPAPDAPDGEISWEQVDLLRKILTEADSRSARTAALYRLGQLHAALGYPREASYYFDRARNSGAPLQDVALDQANARFGSGAFEEARPLCQDAFSGGAPDKEVLECLGLLSLATGSPAPAPTGRALVRASGQPETLLLAAQLLQVDGYHREALPLLEAIVEARSTVREAAWASLGDARLYLGDHDGARNAWRWASSGELGKVTWLRQRTLMIMTQGPAAWPGEMPDFYVRSDDTGPVGADALYLLAQMTETLGDLDAAAEHYHELLRRYPERSLKTDVGQRHWRVVSQRMEDLQRQDRALELAAFYEDTWDPSLVEIIEDPTPMAWVAQAYETLGLPDRALDVQRDLFAVNMRLDRKDPDNLLHLAQLYERTDHCSDALETLDWMRRSGIPTELQGAVHLLEGDCHAGLGEEAQAMSSWRQAAQSPELRKTATARMALADAEAGRCTTAIPALQGLAASRPEPPEVEEGRVHLALAVCLDEQGDLEATAQAAKQAAGRLDDELSRRFAMWLADKAIRELGQEDLVIDAVQSGDDLWAALDREAEAHEAFQAVLKGEEPE